MKSLSIIISILVLTTVILSSCAQTPEQMQNIYTTDTEDKTNDVTEPDPDPFEKVRASGEEWLLYGLSAYENGKEAQDLRDFFAVPSNMTYLTLYDHFFTYDKGKSVPVAEALFRFIVDKYGADALLDTEKRIEYKSAYLRSLGLDTAYTQSPEVESLLASMEFSSDSTYKYIISFGNITYYFKNFGVGSPSQYHGFLYYSTTGLYDMIEYLKANNLSDGLDTEREFNFYMTFDGSVYSKTIQADGSMYINDGYSTLHEALHAMGITKKDNIWLSEGICNYFGKMLGFNDQIAASYIQMMTIAKQGYFDELAADGDQGALMNKEIYEQYTANGGKLDNVDSFDLRLYFDINAKLEYNTYKNVSLGEANKIAFKKEFVGVGAELTYSQATSLTAYLADVYGIEKVLEAYHTQDIEKSFGKTYEALKTEWLDYLH